VIGGQVRILARVPNRKDLLRSGLQVTMTIRKPRNDFEAAPNPPDTKGDAEEQQPDSARRDDAA
jgi:hypothetical protein